MTSNSVPSDHVYTVAAENNKMTLGSSDHVYTVAAENNKLTSANIQTKVKSLEQPISEKVCLVCNKVLPTGANLSFHLMLHPCTEKPYSCDHCLFISMSKDELWQHCKDFHKSNKEFVCQVCHKIFTNIRSLNKHKPLHSAKLPFYCAYCDRGFPESVRWRHHEVSHKIGKFQCEKCQVRFTTMKAYTEHCDDGNCESKILKCCNQEFLTRMEYVSHCYEYHRKGQLNDYRCEFCDKPHAFRYHLDMHMRHCVKRRKEVLEGNESDLLEEKSLTVAEVKPEQEVFKCDICSKIFNRKVWLMNHRRQHFDPSYTTCNLCNKKYSSYTAMYYHKQSVHLKIRRFKCSYCGKAFITGQALQSHVYSHTGVLPYACKYCPKRFRHRGSVFDHARQHTGERPYHCKYCDQTFARRHSLRQHERRHTGEKPFKCLVCDKSFTQSSTWRSHEKRHKPPFICPYCGIEVPNKDDFVIHKKNHAEEEAVLEHSETVMLAGDEATENQQSVQTICTDTVVDQLYVNDGSNVQLTDSEGNVYHPVEFTADPNSNFCVQYVV